MIKPFVSFKVSNYKYFLSRKLFNKYYGLIYFRHFLFNLILATSKIIQVLNVLNKYNNEIYIII